jgi:hypothetical protein
MFHAVPLLRELATSNDYMLAGEAIVALAKLEDDAFRPRIEQIIAETKNPRLKIMGVQAFAIYCLPNTLPLLLDILRGADPPPYLRDEVVLSIAQILDIQNKFYPLLIRFLADESMVQMLALDEAESAYEYFVSVHGRKRPKKNAALTALAQQAKNIQPAISNYVRHSNGSAFSRWILEMPDDLANEMVQMIFSETVLDGDFVNQGRLQLLIVCWATQKFRFWTDRLKEER